MADWGPRIPLPDKYSQQITSKNPDYVIHLGDTYYAGTAAECQASLDMWPLRDAQNNPVPFKSFALNGNHEMLTAGLATITAHFYQRSNRERAISKFGPNIGSSLGWTRHTRVVAFNHPEVKVQWDWLVGNLSIKPLLSTIFLTESSARIGACARVFGFAAIVERCPNADSADPAKPNLWVVFRSRAPRNCL